MKYIVETGDTLESVAIKFFGNSAKAPLIYESNPSVFGRSSSGINTKEILLIGETLLIPNVSRETFPLDKEKKITLLVNGREFKLFDGLTLNLALDAIAHTFAFSAPNSDDLDPFFYDAFLPFSYADVEIFYGGNRILLGQIVKPNFSDTTIVLEGYSKSGVLLSCNMSPSSYPRQLKNITLVDVVKKLASPFGISVSVSPSASEMALVKYKELEVGVTDTIADYIIGLAQERGLVLRPDSNGGLLLDSVDIDAEEVLYFDSEENPTLPMSCSYNGDSLFSDYIALSSESQSGLSSKSLEKFPIVGVTRTHVITQDSGDSNRELREYNKSEIGRTVREAISFSASHYGWENRNGELFLPGQIVAVRNRRVRIFSKTRFLISALTLTSSESNGRQVSFEFSIASSYQNKLEEFWQKIS